MRDALPGIVAIAIALVIVGAMRLFGRKKIDFAQVMIIAVGGVACATIFGVPAILLLVRVFHLPPILGLGGRG